jgi:hypothetical protein
MASKKMAARVPVSKRPESAADDGSALSRTAGAIGETIVDFVSKIPSSSLAKRKDAADEARKLTSAAAAKASLAAGTLALPPGPLGWLTIVPELLAVWKIQAQLVADIAAVHGVRAGLTQEHMLLCLFKHASAQVARDLVIQVGGQMLVKRATLRVIQRIAKAVGIKIAQRGVAKGLARWLPLVGAIGVAGYAYYDTAQVGETSNEVFAGMARAPKTGASGKVAQRPKPAAKSAKPAAPRAAGSNGASRVATKSVARKTNAAKQAASTTKATGTKRLPGKAAANGTARSRRASV